MEILPYKRAFKRDKFDCGKTSLNNYILKNVTNDVKVGACTCFVILKEHENVIGYYTLSSESISINDAPENYRNKIKYPYVPVILLGRLAIDKNETGNGFGKYLLVDSLKRSLKVAKEYIGAVAVIVDPIDDEAISFYEKYGFTLLPNSGRMFMSMKKIESVFQEKTT